MLFPPWAEGAHRQKPSFLMFRFYEKRERGSWSGLKQTYILHLTLDTCIFKIVIIIIAWSSHTTRPLRSEVQSGFEQTNILHQLTLDICILLASLPVQLGSVRRSKRASETFSKTAQISQDFSAHKFNFTSAWCLIFYLYFLTSFLRMNINVNILYDEKCVQYECKLPIKHYILLDS